MSSWIWSFLKRRGTNTERAAAGYLAWEFLFSVDGMAEHLAYQNALKGTKDALRSTLAYGGNGHYYTVTDFSVEPNPAFEKRAARLRSKFAKSHIRHLKRRLARFRRQPVPETCRTFADYQETALELDIYCLVNGEQIPLFELLDRKREQLAAMERAHNEILQLREQYRDSFSEELKSVRGRCERKMASIVRYWRF